MLTVTVIVTGLGYLIVFILASCSMSMVHFLILLPVGMGSSIITTKNKDNINEDLTQAVERLGQPWHAICLNEYLKSYSAFERYDEGLVVGKNLVILDGAYSLIPLYEGLIYPAIRQVGM